MKSGKIIAYLALLFSGVFFLLSIYQWWSPPTYELWKVRLIAQEWSGWCLVAAGLLSFLLAIAVLRSKDRVYMPALGLSISSVGLFGLPIADTLQLAAEKNTQVSLQRYFYGYSADFPAKVTRDVSFSSHLDLDVYQPSVESNARPAVLVIHGGGWSRGAKGDYERYNRWLAGNGFVVFDCNYRLAKPDAQFPCQLNDVQEALKWVLANGTKYGADPGRVALLGRSAGAQLALLTAYVAGECTDPSANRPVKAVVGFYGPTDLIWGYRNIPEPDVIQSRWLLENYLGGDPDQRKDTYITASPLTRACARSAPTLLVHGKIDRIVSVHHSEAMLETLQKLGVPAEILILPHAEHAFDQNFDGLNSQIEQQVVLRFLKKYLDPQPDS